ncbi:hypothetical protein HMPREF1988_00527 [Porphyromonas gingivalis F0185]|nr:hypothetical protein HMPREF1988_00527 [Porphyromonas gingivalis F0185]
MEIKRDVPPEGRYVSAFSFLYLLCMSRGVKSGISKRPELP